MSYVDGVQGKTLEVKSAEFEVTIPIGVSYVGAFDGLRAIYTKSKNNRLRWIRDWLTFHVEEHGVNAALIYDNGSTDYAPEDVLDLMTGVQGLEAGVVVSWPYKFGPQAGPSGRFDSDFFEYVVGSDAQRRFLGSSSGVIHADVDELVLTGDGRSVFEHLNDSKTGYLRYHGSVVEGTPTNTNFNQEDFSFQDFGYVDPQKALSTPKWSCLPGRLPSNVQWRTHSIHGMTTAIYSGVIHRHFYAVSTGWKFRRSATGLAKDWWAIDQPIADALQRHL
ncbi:hypothetical protein [Zafaria sp. J156]|nr:hypothetical protein [Zafaria sp. J156]MEE1620758.1 hypothetical protein [Zafaria sp. J156]